MTKPTLEILPYIRFYAGEKVTTITKGDNGERVSTTELVAGEMEVTLHEPAGNGFPDRTWHHSMPQPSASWKDADVIKAVQAAFPDYEVSWRYPERTVDLTNNEE